MKNYLFTLIALIGCTFSSKAQFTITKDNVPTKYNEEYRIIDTLIAGSISPGNSGSNQTWDFSAMHSHLRDTSTYLDPVGTPAANSFPQANLVQYNRKNGYIYIDVTDNYFGALGLYAPNTAVPGSHITPKFNPVYKPILFPSSYLSAHKDTQIFKVTFYYGKQVNIGGFPVTVDSVRIKHRAYGDDVIDAYGKLITPIVTCTNTMRMKEYTIASDTIEGRVFGTWQLLPGQPPKDTTTQYTWYSDQYRLGMAQLIYKGKNLQSAGGSYLTNLSKATAVKESIASKDLTSVFPNPANEEVNIHVSDNNATLVEIFDITGKRIAMLDARLQKQFKINTCHYNEGLYLYKISGSTIVAGKFSVVK